MVMNCFNFSIPDNNLPFEMTLRFNRYLLLKLSQYIFLSFENKDGTSSNIESMDNFRQYTYCRKQFEDKIKTVAI